MLKNKTYSKLQNIEKMFYLHNYKRLYSSGGQGHKPVWQWSVK